MKREVVRHKEKKDSTAKWIILAIIPLVNLYFLWKTAELVVVGHEKVARKYEAIAHREEKGSTAKWFILGLIPIVNLYVAWKALEAVSGHEKIISGQYEAMGHAEKKDSTAKLFILALIPLVNLYVLYKLAQTVAGHEKGFADERSMTRQPQQQAPQQEGGEKCPDCGDEMRYIEDYTRWYCDSCEEYK